MVDGAHGHVDHVLRHVVLEQRIVAEYVIILYLSVEEVSVLAQEVLVDIHALSTILVRCIVCKYSYVCT